MADDLFSNPGEGGPKITEIHRPDDNEENER